MQMARIKDATVIDAEVEVRWADDAPPARFSNFWLRDHCHSEQSLHPETLQRQVDTFSIQADLAVDAVSVADGGARLNIVWASGAGSSEFPAAFLRHIADTSGAAPKPERRLWDRAALGNSLPSTPYAEIMESEEGLLRWLQQIMVYGFSIATETPATPEATQALCERIAYIRQTIFGGFWDFTADLAFKDTAYTPLPIGPHTDGTYSNDPPGLQMLHCLKFDGTGAQNTLVLRAGGIIVNLANVADQTAVLQLGQCGQRRLQRTFDRTVGAQHAAQVDDLQPVQAQMAQVVVHGLGQLVS